MTMAVRLPAVVGSAVNVTVSEVEVAAVTVPIAPSFNVTVLLPGVGSKPEPVIVNVARVGGQIGRTAGHDRRDRGHLHRRAADHIVRRDNRRQWAGRGRLGGKRYRKRSRGGRGDGADRAVVERDRVVADGRIEAEADDRQARAAWPAGRYALLVDHDRRDRGHLRRAAGRCIGGDRGGQIAHGGRRRGDRHGERVGRRRGYGADRAVVKDDRVIADRGIESIAVDRERGGVDRQIGRAAGHDGRHLGDLHRRAARLTVGMDHGRQVAGKRRALGESHGERSRGRRGDGARRRPDPSVKVTESLPTVVSKPKPAMVSEVALAARPAVLLVTTGVTVRHLHRQAAAGAVGRDDGGERAGSGRLGGERHGERRGGRRGDAADRAVVEGDRVIADGRIEAEAVDGDRGRVGGQAAVLLVTTGVAVATCTSVLATEFVVTVAVIVPAVGSEGRVTVSDVAASPRRLCR